jgi:hypothetical protein
MSIGGSLDIDFTLSAIDKDTSTDTSAEFVFCVGNVDPVSTEAARDFFWS